jgi:hypothetical protein
LKPCAWAVSLVCIVAAGILSRAVQTGFLLLDKYLGDALYAAMVYVIFRLCWATARPRIVGVTSAIATTVIELFQLTGLPAQMSTSANPMVRTGARLLGTEFSWLDLTAYAVGIATLLWLDLIMIQRRTIGHPQAG